MIAFAGFSATADDLFPDKNLEAVVRQNVFEKRNKPDPLVEADVVNISDDRRQGKENREPARAGEVQEPRALELENNEIADLAPIKDLKLIQSVNLAKNKIESIAPLAELTGIQYLRIQDNQIADLSPAGEDRRDGLARSVEQSDQGHRARSPD